MKYARYFAIVSLLLSANLARSITYEDIQQLMLNKDIIGLRRAFNQDKNLVNLKSHLMNQTFFHEAINQRSIEIVKLLIELDADVNARDINGHTPLHDLASYNGDVEIVHCANNSNSKNTNDYEFIQRDIIELANLLINSGANVNVKNNDGRTPLHYAVEVVLPEIEKIKLELVKLFIARGADVNAKDKDGRTPCNWAFDWASKAPRTNKEIVRLLKN